MIKKGGKHVSYSLNEKIKDLKPYDPIQGEYQIRLDANESFCPFQTKFWSNSIPL